MSDRTVKRVLVMLEYGDGDPDNGEVFDLTALAAEMLPKSPWSARIGLDVRATKTYERDPSKPQYKLALSWNGDAGQWVSGATHVEDVVNSALPDGERVTGLKKRAERLKKKAASLEHDAMRAKLEQVAGVRHQYPIARVTESPLMIEEKT